LSYLSIKVYILTYLVSLVLVLLSHWWLKYCDDKYEKEGLAVASIARDVVV